MRQTLQRNEHIQRADRVLAMDRIYKIYHIRPQGSHGLGHRRPKYCRICLHSMRHRHMKAQSISARAVHTFRGRRSRCTGRRMTVRWHTDRVYICSRCHILHRTGTSVPEDRSGEFYRRYPAASCLLRKQSDHSTEAGYQQIPLGTD